MSLFEIKGQIAQSVPIAVDVMAGRSYWSNACGLSKHQPFCDSSHKATALVPVEHNADANRRVVFCPSKQTNNRPQCDGSHAKL